MKIKVNNRTVFLFPTALIANFFTAGIIRRKLKKDGIKLNRKQTILFIRDIKRYKKFNSDWNLVEVDCENGDKIFVKI